MTKVLIEFNLPDDKHDMDECMRGAKFARAISDYGEWLRTMNKHGLSSEMMVTKKDLQDMEPVEDRNTFIACLTLERTRDKFWDIVNSCGANPVEEY